MANVPEMSSSFREFIANTNPAAALSQMEAHGADYGVVFDHNDSPSMLLTLEDFILAEKTGVETILHPRAKLRPTIVMPGNITIAKMLEHPAVTLLEHGARGAIVVHRNEVKGVVGADIFMKELGSGSLSDGGLTRVFSIQDSMLGGNQELGFANVMCKACGYLNQLRFLDVDHLPICQNPKPPEHTLKP